MSVLRLATRAIGNAGLPAAMIGVVVVITDVVVGGIVTAVVDVNNVEICVVVFLVREALLQHGDICGDFVLYVLVSEYAVQISS